jgi:hypothetical protein
MGLGLGFLVIGFAIATGFLVAAMFAAAAKLKNSGTGIEVAAGCGGLILGTLIGGFIGFAGLDGNAIAGFTWFGLSLKVLMVGTLLMLLIATVVAVLSASISKE